MNTSDHMNKRYESLIARTIPAGDGCRQWSGHVSKGSGYGMTTKAGKTVYVHRLMWQVVFGPIPAGMQINHTCDVKTCINPAHLYAGTHADNMADKIVRNRVARLYGESNPGAKLSEDEVKMIRSDRRSQKDIAKAYGISRSLVGLIKNRVRWPHVC